MVSGQPPGESLAGLTARQRDIASFIAESVAAGRPPSRADIARRFRCNRATAQQHVEALESHGVLRRVPGARGLQLVRQLVPAARQIPVLGRVPAGVPLLAVEDPDDVLTISDGLFRRTPDLFLRVAGDSMQGAGIYNGDLVAIVIQPTAESGDIVVARLADEITVKRLRWTSQRFELVAEHPAYAAIRIEARHDFSIEGVVVGTVRRL